MKRLLVKGVAALGIAAVAIAAIGLYPRFFGPKRLRFTYLTGALPREEYEKLGAQPGWSTASAQVAPGIELKGLVRKPAAPDAPWILYYPGNDATQLARGQAFLSHLNEGHDWGLAVFAYRGYDSSSGTPRVDDLAADAPQILLELCKAQKIAPSSVNVIGFSIGGYLAVRATASLTKQNQAPRSLSLMASVNDIVMLRRSLWAKLDPGDDFLTQPYLADLRAPVLIVQGGADETLEGPVQGQAIAKTLGDRARYVELPGVGHNVLIQTPSAIDAVRSFIASLGK